MRDSWCWCILLIVMACVGFGTGTAMAQELSVAPAEPAALSPLWVLPFAAMLLSIALLPLIHAHWWERHMGRVTLGLFVAPMAIIFLGFMGPELRADFVDTMLEYVTFITLLAGLFIISGGILLRGHLAGKPSINTVILAIGGVLASVIGTTGAAMLLIRPFLRANRERPHKVHGVIFFIFIVANCGGLLTPLGDPPLFLGFLQGVPFQWTVQNLFSPWLFCVGMLLLIFYSYDSWLYRQEGRPPLHPKAGVGKLYLRGKWNLLLLGGVVLTVFLQGLLRGRYSWWPKVGPSEAVLIPLMLLSLKLAGPKSELRRANEFTFGPIKEVALLFAGVFATMVPALYILNHKGAALGITEPWQFFWGAGGLSSLLDNAPTYLAFLEVGKSLHLPSTLGFFFHDGTTLPRELLAALSCGSVFMGANTYIGNGPNFMVRAIAAEHGVPMPSFFGYMLYSGAILIPLFVVITFIFF